MNASFFLNLYPRFSKKDIYKCPFFKRGLRELKFSYIITLSASALPFSRGYLYALFYFLFYYRFRALWCGYMFANFSQKMGQNMANLFFIKQGWSFSGDVWNIRRNQNSIYVPKMGVLVLTPFLIFIPTFWGIFRISMEILYCNLLSTFNYIIYKTYLKKP